MNMRIHKVIAMYDNTVALELLPEYPVHTLPIPIIFTLSKYTNPYAYILMKKWLDNKDDLSKKTIHVDKLVALLFDDSAISNALLLEDVNKEIFDIVRDSEPRPSECD